MSNKILSAILSIAVLLLTWFLYQEASTKGFPDGHLTPYDRAVLPIYWTIIYAGTLYCPTTLILTWSRPTDFKQKLFLIINIVYFMSLTIFFMTITVMGSILNSGQGG
ncbi:MAG: hypothetical protein ACRBBN_13435 [Methyloligellaceae bacterium]